MSENNRRAVAIFAGFFAGLYPYFYGTYLASSLTALAVAGKVGCTAQAPGRPERRPWRAIPDLTCMSVRDRGQVAFDMWQAIRARGYRPASKSSIWGLRYEQQARAPADRRGSDGRANTNLPRAAASAARKGGRVPKTELRMEKCVAMPY